MKMKIKTTSFLSFREGAKRPLNNFPAYLEKQGRLVDKALDAYLPRAGTRPAKIHKAMRYSLFIGGKRVRPILCLAACEAAGGNARSAMPAACALEIIHTYSLIHDDLPCMDDDDLRRGKPTSHKVFGEGMAVLAGDALLTFAFELLASNPTRLPAATALEITHLLGIAAGSQKLIGGQAEDLQNEGKRISPSALRYIHLNKTAALIEASVTAGVLVAGTSAARRKNLESYGRNIGLAFQIADDILDVVGDEKKMGKRARKDANLQKATYPGLFGLEKSRILLRVLTGNALRDLSGLGRKAEPLRAMARFIASRDR